MKIDNKLAALVENGKSKRVNNRVYVFITGRGNISMDNERID